MKTRVIKPWPVFLLRCFLLGSKCGSTCLSSWILGALNSHTSIKRSISVFLLQAWTRICCQNSIILHTFNNNCGLTTFWKNVFDRPGRRGVIHLGNFTKFLYWFLKNFEVIDSFSVVKRVLEDFWGFGWYWGFNGSHSRLHYDSRLAWF